MARSLTALKILLFLHLAFLAASRPLPPYHLKCERSLVGLKEHQLKEVHKVATIAIDNPNPLLSWTLQHTGMLVTMSMHVYCDMEQASMHAVSVSPYTTVSSKCVLKFNDTMPSMVSAVLGDQLPMLFPVYNY